MKRKLKIMNHQIDQLKEEIQAKENALLKEHFEHQRVEKDKENLKSELNRLKQQAQESKAYIEAQEAEERKLLKIIAEADAERVRQKKELDQVIRQCIEFNQISQLKIKNSTTACHPELSSKTLLNLKCGFTGDQWERYSRNTIGEEKWWISPSVWENKDSTVYIE